MSPSSTPAHHWLLALVLVGCNGPKPADQVDPPPQPAPTASATQPAATPAEPTAKDETPLPPPMAVPDRATVEAALKKLEGQVRPAAADPANPWALSHGVMAFGSEYLAKDQKPAIDHIMSHAGPQQRDGRQRMGFPKQTADGKPVEPHPHTITRTLLAAGVARDKPFDTIAGEPVTLGQILDDMWREMPEPVGDVPWHNTAWRMEAMDQLLSADKDNKELAAALAPLRLAAMARLEADDAPIKQYEGHPRAAFAPTAPMGAAKRNKSHIYGHACGGFHFIQAVMAATATSSTPALMDRARTQLGLLTRRFVAEHLIYSSMVKQHAQLTLVVSVQQLKFYGHMLETLSLVHPVGLYSNTDTLGRDLIDLREQATAALLQTLKQLDGVAAYERLSELEQTSHQQYLDLIGDGCHAIRALRLSLAIE